MPEYDFDMGIIGGGAAGLTVAAGAAQLGAKTLLIERENQLGGDCLHFGCVPSKTLIRTAHVYHLIRHSKEFGLPSVDPPPVDFKKVAKRIGSVIQEIQKHDSEERFCSLGAKVEFGSPTFTNEYSIRLNKKTYSAKTWVITTGSSPDIPVINGINETPFITNREIFSLNQLPNSMIILGAGPVAIEMAQSFCRLGSKVMVVQRSAQILSKEDKVMADEVMQTLISEGVKFYLDSSIVEAKNLGKENEVIIKNSDGRTFRLKAEKILVAMGREANVLGLGLENTNITFDKKGIKVDSRLRSSQGHIYAAGDVIGAYQYTHAAGYEGGIVLSNAIFHLPRKVNYTLLPWCTYTDPELASIGMNEKRAKAAGIPYSVYTEKFRDNDRSLAEGAYIGKIKMVLNEKEKPIGIQILGPQAGELLNEWVASLNGNVKLSTLASAVHPYPTLGEINKRVVGTFFSPKIFSEKVRKGLKIFFQLKGRACG
jgi:pyruvate/2-oxoglutarate dehydrogenase complex dihydrolipoamide dehydrogenase (E3) component